jgi:hypothetical protein
LSRDTLSRPPVPLRQVIQTSPFSRTTSAAWSNCGARKHAARRDRLRRPSEAKTFLMRDAEIFTFVFD